jgi:S-methylmethionine-dependent homocysteine/selenocysteine methylase
MIPDFKYDHEVIDLDKSIGVDDKFQDELMTKVNIVVRTLNDNNQLRQSRILEEIVAICSDEQIAFMALCFINDKLKDISRII